VRRGHPSVGALALTVFVIEPIGPNVTALVAHSKVVQRYGSIFASLSVTLDRAALIRFVY
jgi:hypothetical protein